jgi:hypothetical protein
MQPDKKDCNGQDGKRREQRQDKVIQRTTAIGWVEKREALILLENQGFMAYPIIRCRHQTLSTLSEE